MATYSKRGKSWRAEICRDGIRESGTFKSKTEAVAWATQRELELVGAVLPDKTLKHALRRYAAEVAPTHKGERWEVLRLALMERAGMASRRLATLTPAHLAEWRDTRLQAVSGASVAREMNLLRSVLEVARKEWGWLKVNPITDVRRPASPPSRKRRVTADEIDRLTMGFGLGDGLAADTSTNRTGLAFLFAIETAMRAGEITGLAWGDIAGPVATLPLTKNGDRREVPLSPKARAILAALPVTDAPIFDLNPGTRDMLFRRIRDRCRIVGLHFHDSRSEAIWRLSKKFDVMELARVIGHRDLRSLLLYYRADAAELAARLE